MTDVPIDHALVVVAALLAAFMGSMFSALESSLSVLPLGRLESLAKDPHNSAGPLFARYLADRARLLTRWLVGRVFLFGLSALLMEHAFLAHTSGPAASIGGVVSTLVVYTFCAEIFGTLGRRRPERMGALGLRVARPIEWLMAPVAEPIRLVGRVVLSRTKPSAQESTITATDLNWVVNESQRSGVLGQEPADIIRNALEFKNLTVREVMVPRRGVTGIEQSTPLDRVLAIVAAEGHSRYPVYRDTIDNVVGLLYAKDLFALIRDQKLAASRLQDIARRPVLFVSESQPAGSVLKEMRGRRLHMAVVIDEFGGTSGIVTLEDVLEEIVGDIRDEYDTEADAPIQRMGDGRIVADAAVPLSDLVVLLGRPLPTDGEFESLGGLLIHRAGRVPRAGSTLRFDGLKFVVREADETRIVKVEIVPDLPERKELSSVLGTA